MIKELLRKTDAEIFARAVKKEDLSEWYEGKKAPKELLSMLDLASTWLDHSKTVREISDSCYPNYSALLKYHILPRIGSKPVHLLKLIDIEDLAQDIKKLNHFQDHMLQ